MKVSQRQIVKATGWARSTLRYKPKPRPQRDALIVQLAKLRKKHPKWGYRKTTQCLKNEGQVVNFKQVAKIWTEQGWQCVARRVAKNKAQGSEANACHIRKAIEGNEVWAIDFVKDKTMDANPLKIMTVIDEYTREALAVEVERSMGQKKVTQILEKLISKRGAPRFIRSDNGSEFTGNLIRAAMEKLSVELAFIAPGSPWQNGKNERFNGILRHEALSNELFGSLLEAKVVCDEFKNIYNEIRPHGSLKLMTPDAYAKEAKASKCWYNSSQINNQDDAAQQGNIQRPQGL